MHYHWNYCCLFIIIRIFTMIFLFHFCSFLRFLSFGFPFYDLPFFFLFNKLSNRMELNFYLFFYKFAKLSSMFFERNNNFDLSIFGNIYFFNFAIICFSIIYVITKTVFIKSCYNLKTERKVFKEIELVFHKCKKNQGFFIWYTSFLSFLVQFLYTF